MSTVFCNTALAVKGPLRTSTKYDVSSYGLCQAERRPSSPRKSRKAAKVPQFFIWGMPKAKSQFNGITDLKRNEFFRAGQSRPSRQATAEDEMQQQPELRTPWPGPGAVVRARRRSSTLIPDSEGDLAVDNFLRGRAGQEFIFARFPGCCSLDAEQGYYQFQGPTQRLERLSLEFTPCITFQLRISEDDNSFILEVVESEFQSDFDLNSLVDLKASCTLSWVSPDVPAQQSMCQISNMTEVELQVALGERMNTSPSALQTACNNSLQSILDDFSDRILRQVRDSHAEFVKARGQIPFTGTTTSPPPAATPLPETSNGSAGPPAGAMPLVTETSDMVFPEDLDMDLTFLEEQIFGLDDKLEALANRNEDLEKELERKKAEQSTQESEIAALREELRQMQTGQGSVIDATARQAELQAEVDSLRREKQEAQGVQASLAEQVQALQQQQQLQAASVQATQQDQASVQQLNTQIEAMKAEAEAREQVLLRKEEEMMALVGELDNIRKVEARKEEELKALVLEADDLRKLAERKEQEVLSEERKEHDLIQHQAELIQQLQAEGGVDLSAVSSRMEAAEAEAAKARGESAEHLLALEYMQRMHQTVSSSLIRAQKELHQQAALTTSLQNQIRQMEEGGATSPGSRAELSAMECQLQAMQERERELEGEKLELEQTLEQTQRELREVGEKLQEYEQEMDAQAGQVESALVGIRQQLEAAQAQSAQDRQAYQDQLDQRKQELQQAAEAREAELQEELQRAQEDLQQALQAEVEAAEAQSLRSQAAKLEYENNIKHFETLLEAQAVEAVEKAQAAAEEATRVAEAVAAQELESLRRELQLSRSEEKKMVSQLNSVERELELARLKEQRIEVSLSEATSQINKFQGEGQELLNDLTKVRTELDVSRANEKQANAEMANLKVQLEAKEAEEVRRQSDLEAQVTKLKGDLADAEEKVENSDAGWVEQLTFALEAAKSELDLADQRVEQVRAQTKQAVDRKEAEVRQLYDITISRLEKQEAKYLSQLDEAKDKAIGAVVGHQRELQELKEEHKGKMDRLKIDRMKQKTLLKESQMQNSLLEKSIKALSAAKEREESQNSKWQKEVARLEDLLKQKEERSGRVRNIASQEEARLLAKLSQVRQEAAEKLKRVTESKDKEIKKLFDKLRESEARLMEEQESIETLEDQMMSEMEENEKRWASEVERLEFELSTRAVGEVKALAKAADVERKVQAEKAAAREQYDRQMVEMAQEKDAEIQRLTKESQQAISQRDEDQRIIKDLKAQLVAQKDLVGNDAMLKMKELDAKWGDELRDLQKMLETQKKSQADAKAKSIAREAELLSQLDEERKKSEAEVDKITRDKEQQVEQASKDMEAIQARELKQAEELNWALKELNALKQKKKKKKGSIAAALEKEVTEPVATPEKIEYTYKQEVEKMESELDEEGVSVEVAAMRAALRGAEGRAQRLQREMEASKEITRELTGQMQEALEVMSSYDDANVSEAKENLTTRFTNLLGGLAVGVQQGLGLAGGQQQQTAPASEGRAPASATSSSSSSSVVEPGPVSLVIAGASASHPQKEKGDCEDVLFFSVTESRASLGICDGVSGWKESGGPSSKKYAAGLVSSFKELLDATPPDQQTVDLTKVISETQGKEDLQMPGSATMVLASLNNNTNILQMANLGDTGLRVIRDKGIIYASESQEFEPNMPFQIGSPKFMPETCSAKDVMLSELELLEGDVIIMGTDGLFDNVFDEEIAYYVARMESNDEKTAKITADLLVECALQYSLDEQCITPFSERFTLAEKKKMEQQGKMTGTVKKRVYTGGKPDDITCVIACVKRT